MRQSQLYIWLSVGALALRLFGLGGESLGYDESFTAWLSALPFDSMIAATSSDVHPPLFYIVEWLAVSVLGESEFVLRLPAAIFGALAAGLVAYLADITKAGRRAPFIAGGLYAVLGAPLFFGREARMYSLLTVWVLLAGIALVKRRRVWFACFALGAMYTHNLAILYIASLAIAALLTKRRAMVKQLIRFWLPAGGAVLVGYMPYLIVLISQLSEVDRGFWLQAPSGIGGILYPLYFVTFGTRTPPPLQAHAATLAVALTLAALVAARRWWMRPGGRVVLALAAMPPALALLVSYLWQPMYLNRAFMPAGAALLVLWAAGLEQIRKPTRRAASVAIVPLLLWGLLGFAQAQREPVRDWSGLVAEDWQTGDVLYHANAASLLPMSYYLPSGDYPAYLFPQKDGLFEALTAPTMAAMGIEQRGPDEIEAGRVWLAVVEAPTAAPIEGAITAQLLRTYPARLVMQTEDNNISMFSLWVVDVGEGGA